ncbi:Predicted hydrocarbon binding protein [Fructobacillus tropaeoli]|uniref:YslB family protein n=1 Tax=Fructobacillus tropaeoli TaxID=709323 RepID=UPI002D8C754D|nr:Predicted hydrocarbon binding protein [Fructobacillus tropaeoli]
MSNAHSQSNNGTNQTVSAFAPLLLRDALLANILTDDYANITYWAGKELARQFPVETSADLPAFFEKAAFGDLTIKYQSGDQQQWLLSGAMVEDRLATNHQADFSLETGFLAQQLELQEEVVAEGTFQVSARQQTVTVTILTDMSHKISSLTSSEQVALRDRFLDQGEEIVTEDIDNPEALIVNRQSVPVDEPAIQISEVDQATSEAPVEVEPAESAAPIEAEPTTSAASVETNSAVSTAPMEEAEPTTSAASSNTEPTSSTASTEAEPAASTSTTDSEPVINQSQSKKSAFSFFRPKKNQAESTAPVSTDQEQQEAIVPATESESATVVAEPTSEPTDSQVADTLSIEQSITNSLLAFGQERRQKFSQKDDSSLNK